MSRLPVQPTKSNLLSLREELDFARTGHQLLQEKREILLMRIRELIEDLHRRQGDLYRELALCYRALTRAALSVGWTKLDSVHVRPEGQPEVTFDHKHYMGIDLPQVHFAPPSSRPHYSPAGSNSLLDDAQRRFVELLAPLVEYAELQAHLWSLSLALKKTMKRVNALENLFIPDYEDTVTYVTETLEEIEREETYVRKLIKESKRERRHSQNV